MANTPITIALPSSLDLPLITLLPNTLLAPYNITINNDSIALTSDNHKENDDNSLQVELIVLENTTLNELFNLAAISKITLIQLTQINHRLGQISYRFNVQCDDLVAAKKALADYCFTIKKEAVLIKHAPLLTEPGLLVMDMDSTTIEIECIDEIAKLAGVGPEVAEVTELAMQGKLDFCQSLIQRVATLKGSPESILASVAEKMPLMSGLLPLIHELKKHHWKIAIASGGFTYFADKLKQSLFLDAAVANNLVIKNGVLTGEVEGNIVDANMKALTLLNLQNKFHIAKDQTIAMGDGANDLIMMNAAHLGVAYKAKPLVLKQADTSINFTGLDTLIHWLK